MSDKYIIKNCPAYQKELVTMDFETGETKVTDKNVCINPFYPNTCQDCTDCVLKQIVELAKGHTELCKNCDQQIKECDCSDICNAYRLDKILKLLDIQEVE